MFINELGFNFQTRTKRAGNAFSGLQTLLHNLTKKATCRQKIERHKKITFCINLWRNINFILIIVGHYSLAMIFVIVWFSLLWKENSVITGKTKVHHYWNLWQNINVILTIVEHYLLPIIFFVTYILKILIGKCFSQLLVRRLVLFFIHNLLYSLGDGVG